MVTTARIWEQPTLCQKASVTLDTGHLMLTSAMWGWCYWENWGSGEELFIKWRLDVGGEIGRSFQQMNESPSFRGEQELHMKTTHCIISFIKIQKSFPGAKLVKKLPVMQETCVWSQGQEDPLKKGMATYSSILAWKIPQTPTDRGDWQATDYGVTKSQTQLSH